MNNHNKILRILIVVMLLTLIISISKLRIDNQVFLKNYYEIAVSEYEGKGDALKGIIASFIGQGY